MNNQSYKNTIVVSLLFLFSIIFAIFVYVSYLDKKEDIEFVNKSIEKKIDNLYNEITTSMRVKQLSQRANFIINKLNSEEKKIAIKNKDTESLKNLLSIHFNNLKEQIDGFKTMHIYDKNGISIIRMHNDKKKGDDLKQYRNCVVSLVENPRKCSFFEVGMEGLIYRHASPIYYNNELIAFLELGVTPNLLVEKIHNVFSVKSYIFLKDNNPFVTNKISNNNLKIDNFELCSDCSKNDKFIEMMLNHIEFNKISRPRVIYEDKTYSIIKKHIHNAKEKHIGTIVIFHDITLFNKQLSELLFKSLFLFGIMAVLSYFIFNKYVEIVFMKLSKARFLLDNTTDAVYVVSLRDGRVLDVNNRACIMLGFTRDELLSKKLKDFRQPMENEKSLNWEEHVNSLKRNHFMTSRGLHVRKDNTVFPVESNLSYVQDSKEDYMIAVARDITIQLSLENKVQHKVDELERLQDVISNSVLYTTSNLKGDIMKVSKAFEKLTGYKESELNNKNHSIFQSENTSKKFYEDMWSVLNKNERFVGEMCNLTKNKEKYWVKLIIDPLYDENHNKIGYSTYFQNITHKKELEYMSTHDTLTGIHNRGFFIHEISKKINAAKRYNQVFSLIMVDIDFFKKINDTHGHHIGDIVLQSLTATISQNLREDDIFARWGGEEFIIIANGLDEENSIKLIKKLQKAIQKTSFKPVEKLTVSFGLTSYKDSDSDKSIELRVDKALYKAKENGRDRYEIL